MHTACDPIKNRVQWKTTMNRTAQWESMNCFSIAHKMSLFSLSYENKIINIIIAQCSCATIKSLFIQFVWENIRITICRIQTIFLRRHHIIDNDITFSLADEATKMTLSPYSIMELDVLSLCTRTHAHTNLHTSKWILNWIFIEQWYILSERKQLIFCSHF